LTLLLPGAGAALAYGGHNSHHAQVRYVPSSHHQWTTGDFWEWYYSHFQPACPGTTPCTMGTMTTLR
jgi:hypothetical protein